MPVLAYKISIILLPCITHTSLDQVCCCLLGMLCDVVGANSVKQLLVALLNCQTVICNQ